MKAKAITIMMGIFFVGMAQAEWIQYATTATGDAIYYDPDTIAHLSDGKIGVWKKYRADDKAIDTDFDKYAYTLVRFVFDCSLAQVATTSKYAYDINNNTLYSYNSDPSKWKFTDVIPTSHGENLINIVCKKK